MLGQGQGAVGSGVLRQLDCTEGQKEDLLTNLGKLWGGSGGLWGRSKGAVGSGVLRQLECTEGQKEGLLTALGKLWGQGRALGSE